MAVNRVSVEAIDPLGESLGVTNDFGITPRASDHRVPGAASCGFVQRGLARSLVNGKILIGGGLLKGSAPSTVRKVCSSGRGCRRRETLVTVSASKVPVSGPAKVDILGQCPNVRGDAGDGLAARPR